MVEIDPKTKAWISTQNILFISLNHQSLINHNLSQKIGKQQHNKVLAAVISGT